MSQYLLDPLSHHFFELAELSKLPYFEPILDAGVKLLRDVKKANKLSLDKNRPAQRRQRSFEVVFNPYDNCNFRELSFACFSYVLISSLRNI